MPRKSDRVASKNVVTLAHKRAGSSTIVPISTKAKRARTKDKTPAKSPYFEQSSAEGSDNASEESPSADEEASEFGEDVDVLAATEDSGEDEGDEDSDESSKSRKARASRKAASKSVSSKNSEVWRHGVKTGLGPGTEVVIRKPKARPAGDTPYSDDTIHPNTILFLEELKANNNRNWLKCMFFTLLHHVPLLPYHPNMEALH